jgi:signal transduction histidine kinase/ActR/RegA family two-component response regulator
MQDIVGKRFFQSTVKPHIERVLNGEKMFGQRKVRLPNGQTRHIDSAYYPHRDAEGRIIGIISSIRDITDMKKMEKKLQQAQKMEAMGTLAGGVAHDFNNILFSIIGFSELAREYLPPDSPASGHIDEVLASALRATELVKQILAFARQAETRRKPLAVNLLLKEALKMLRASLPTTIQIIQDVQPVPAVIADPTQIHQIIMNLCTNAAHAMQQTGGTLTVRLHVGLPPFVGEDAAASSLPPESIPVCLSVNDTGHGMSPHILTNIFDPYFTTKDKSEGTGLGLAMVHGIVSEMNGYIHVDSAPGQGTTFAICLPAAEKLAKDGYLGPDETVTGGKERILFVDDEPGLVKLNQQRLCHLGYEVVGRTSSIEALNRFQARPDAFDLIISDLTMPNMTGLELAAEMRRIRPDIPFILCTGFSSKLKRPEMDSLDIDEVIMKPIVVAHMAQTIRKVLDRQNR